VHSGHKEQFEGRIYKMATRTKKKTSSRKTSSGSGPKSKRIVRSKMKKTMHEFKHHELKSGRGGKVKNPKQAIAIGLSEARRSGADIPENPRKKKTASKKSGGRTAKKTAAKKTTRKHGAATKSSARKRTSSKRSSSKRSSSKSASARRR
jgi:thiol:disulfide interchange protein